MKHWDIRQQVISAVFNLRQFTVPALCQDTNLDRTQVYPVLKKLESEGFLRSEPLADAKRKAHRPLNLYSLADDAADKQRLMKEILPLLQLAEATRPQLEPESLQQVRAALNEVIPIIENLDRNADDRFSSHRNSLEIVDVREKLGSVSADLELSLIEAGATKEEVPLAIETEVQRFEKAKEQLQDIEARVELIQRRLDAEKCASYPLREIAAYGLAAAGESMLRSSPLRSFASCYPRGQEPRWLEGITEKARRYLVAFRSTGLPFQLEQNLEDEYKQTNNPEFKSILSTMEACLRSAVREAGSASTSSGKSQLFWALAQLAIRYAGDADTTLLAANLLEENVDFESSIVSYNSANLCFLAGNTEQAFSRWRNLSKECGWRPVRSRPQPTYPGLLLAVVPAALLKQDLLEHFETALGMSCSLSIVSPVRLRTVAANPYVLEPTLFNPLEASERVRISDSLRIQAPDLYIYGPIESSVSCPGVPQVALATGLATLGVPSADAWEFAGNVGLERVLIVVNTSRTLEASIVRRLRDFLGVLFAPMRKGPGTPDLISAGKEPTAGLAKEGKPVLYDFGVKGEVRNVLTVTGACNG